jgi:hypothetical protein
MTLQIQSQPLTGWSHHPANPVVPSDCKSSPQVVPRACKLAPAHPIFTIDDKQHFSRYHGDIEKFLGDVFGLQLASGWSFDRGARCGVDADRDCLKVTRFAHDPG